MKLAEKIKKALQPITLYSLMNLGIMVLHFAQIFMFVNLKIFCFVQNFYRK